MNLSDKGNLELNELCNAVVDSTLNEQQRARLSQWLAASEEARRFYARAMALSASLYLYAGEMQAEAPDAVVPPTKTTPAFVWWSVGALATAASIVMALWITGRLQSTDATAELKPDEHAARLTGSKGCQWVNATASARPGEHLRKGQRLELAGGFAEITFDSGALVVLEGPASLDVSSAWAGKLRHGVLKAIVPPEAIGFRISNPAVEIVDLGTEFTMIADSSGAADVLVLKGTVEASPRDGSNERTIVLRENQSRRFAHSGVSDVRNRDQKFARFTEPVLLDHFVPVTDYVHWSFDEAGGRLLKADAFDLPRSAFDARLEAVSDAVLATMRTDGRWQRALRFNGHLFAKAAFPDISGNSPHTVAFWVKVPEDAQLSSAYAMVAWGANSRKLGSHPIHICWNRNPTEGTVGVLRTDYGGGFAMGATPLRDGRWHHVAVVFVPGEDPNTPVEVKQYVDGRLEGEGRTSPPGSEVFTRPIGEDTATVDQAVWLGCRLGRSGPRKDRFLGELDELCIADRALGPREIVQMMKNNKPAMSELATARNQNDPSRSGVLQHDR